MWSFTFWILMAMLHWTVGQIDTSAPSCAVSCWENTKYVSKCLDDNACRCSEAAYQNSLFQCLYSQCDTAHFGFALHHTISRCSSLGSEIILSIPRTPNHDALRKREAEYLAGAKAYGSGSAVGFPVQSTYPTQSANNYPTPSAAGPYSLSATSTPPYFPLKTTRGSAGTSATPTEEYTAAAATAAGPLLYTGPAPEIAPSITVPILVSMAAFYLSL